MKTIRSVVTAALVVIAPSVHAGKANNCDAYLNTTGQVTAVALGDDNSHDENVSFTFVPETDGTPIVISAHKDVENERGQSAYALLLTAFTTKSRIEITRCYSDEVVGFRLRST
jgi:hypothetical protein